MLKGGLPTIRFISLELLGLFCFVQLVCIVTMNHVSVNRKNRGRK